MPRRSNARHTALSLIDPISDLDKDASKKILSKG